MFCFQMGGSTTKQWKDALSFLTIFYLFPNGDQNKKKSNLRQAAVMSYGGAARAARNAPSERRDGPPNPNGDRGRAMDPVAVESRRGWLARLVDGRMVECFVPLDSCG